MKRQKKIKVEQKKDIVQKESFIIHNKYDNKYRVLKLKNYLFVLLIFILVVVMFGKPENKAQTSENEELNKNRHQLTELMHIQKPKILFIGNSVIRDGFSTSDFTDISGINVIRHNTGGTGTAEWYLYLKNVFFYVKNNPVDLIVITFRDKRLTNPKAGTSGEYNFVNHMVSTSNEPLFDRLVLHNNMDNASWFFYKNLAILQQRHIIKNDFETIYKNQISKLLINYKENSADSIINQYFQTDNLNLELLTKIELSEKEEKNKFKNLIDESFLPFIIKMIREKNKQVIFVRYKRRRDLVPESEPEDVKTYNSDLRTYLQSNNIQLIDFTNDVRIKEEHFKNGDHLNEKGRLLFTKLMYEKLIVNCSSFTNQSIRLKK